MSVRALVAAIVASMTVLVPAAAQQTEPSLTLGPMRAVEVEPDAEAVPFDVPWAYVPSPDELALLHAMETLLLDWSWACADGIGIAGPSTVSVPWPPGATRHAGTTTFHVQSTRAASADDPVVCEARANATVERAGGPATATAPLELHVGYVPMLQLQVQWKVLAAGPGEAVVFPIEVHNRGNGATRVRMELAEPVGGGWSVRLPAPFILEPGRGTTVDVRVETDRDGGWNNDEQPVRVSFTPESVRTGEAGTPIDVEFLARVHGFAGPASVAGWLGYGFLAVAVAGGAWALVLLRRRTRPGQ